MLPNRQAQTQTHRPMIMSPLKKSRTAQYTVDMGFTQERFSLGTHMCYLYNDEDERRSVMAQYTNKGLEIGEVVGYFADRETQDLVDSHLADMGIHLPEATDPGQAMFRRAGDIYCPNHHFSPEQTLNQLKILHRQSHDLHHCELRVTGEMSWALAPNITGVERLVEYEARVNLLMETHPLTAICQYDTNQFDGITIFEILKVHPMMVVRGQIVHNPYYVPAREYLTSQDIPIEEP